MKSSPSARSLLSSEQHARLRARSDLWGCYLVGHAWAVIAGSMALVAAYPNPLTYLLAVTLIGSRQLGVLILMHDGAHGLLCRNPRLNRLLSQWLCAYPMLADTDIYRRYHLQHHARTMQADDPDLVLTGHYPIPRRSLQRKLIRDLTGQTGYSQRRIQLQHAWGRADTAWPARVAHFQQALGRQLAANAALFACLAAAGYGHFYLTLWLLPMLTWQQLVLRIRNIAEHAAVPDRDDPFRNARTTEASLLERCFVAPYWVNYHLEHHLLMWVPCYRLPLLQRYLRTNGHGARLVVTKSYRAVLREVTLAKDEAGSEPPRRAERAVGTFGEGFSSRAQGSAASPRAVADGSSPNIRR